MSERGDPADPLLRGDDTDDETILEQAETGLDEDDRLKPEFLSSVLDAVEDGDSETARDLVSPLHPADIADLLELTPSDRRADVASALGDLVGAEVLSELNDYVRDDLIGALAPEQVAEFAAELDTDDAVAMIEDMEEADQQAVLDALDPEDRAAIESALSYPEESAGRLMQRDLVAVPAHMTVGQVIDYLRDNADLTQDFWEIYIVDAAHRPIGYCQLSWILTCPRGIAMTDLMKREQTLIPVDMDQEEVALRFQKYALISAAVVDSAGRLVGMITVDDVVHIIAEEAGEDILRLSGAGEGDINQPILMTVRTRLVWLVVNLGTAMVAASVVGLFEDTIEHLAMLAALMGIVSGMGGNAGTQTLAVMVRAIATNQVTSSNTLRMIVREFRIAATNGSVLGVLIGIGSYLIYGQLGLSLVFATAILINNMVAGLAGVLIPVTLDRRNIDPAVSSAVFVTMMTDSLGFLTFLGLATLFLT
ncbi:magnesium transporter [Sphingobium cupriresistens]|uniref:Magnesium transporter MgtE n=1 Tax=Sphingobium cupriresistens LL01 TaxID=1420583 RepID=A0A0J7XZ68_9SPHN|nr:magnesium transporter [Sphingobium cupriresistens]KMS56864.1 magnesium transporter [Sphingobium cupriresistens LL01]